MSATSFVVRRLFYDLTSRRGCRATWFNNSKSRKAAKINSISGRWSALQRALQFYERAICSAGFKSVLAKHSCKTVKAFRSAQRDNLSSKIKSRTPSPETLDCYSTLYLSPDLILSLRSTEPGSGTAGSWPCSSAGVRRRMIFVEGVKGWGWCNTPRYRNKNIVRHWRRYSAPKPQNHLFLKQFKLGFAKC